MITARLANCRARSGVNAARHAPRIHPVGAGHARDPPEGRRSLEASAMNFRVVPIDATPFESLYGLDDAGLAQCGARACIADSLIGFPCRVSLRDAAPGERLILLNHEHLPSPGPY